MPKKIDAAVKERALLMIADQRQEYAPPTDPTHVVAAGVGAGKETVRQCGCL